MVKRLGGREQSVQGVRWTLRLVYQPPTGDTPHWGSKPTDRARFSGPYGSQEQISPWRVRCSKGQDTGEASSVSCQPRFLGRWDPQHTSSPGAGGVSPSHWDEMVPQVTWTCTMQGFIGNNILNCTWKQTSIQCSFQNSSVGAQLINFATKSNSGCVSPTYW